VQPGELGAPALQAQHGVPHRGGRDLGLGDAPSLHAEQRDAAWGGKEGERGGGGIRARSPPVALLIILHTATVKKNMFYTPLVVTPSFH